MELINGIICQHAITDKSTNSLSLINIIEGITVNTEDLTINNKKIPAVFDLVYLFYDYKNNKERKVDLIIELFDSKKVSIEKFKTTFQWEEGKKRMRIHVKIDGIKVKNSGHFYFQAKYKEAKSTKYKESTIIPLDIKINKVIPAK